MSVDEDALQIPVGAGLIEMTDEVEMAHIGASAHANRSDLARSKTIQGLFEEQVVLTPHSVALEFGARQLSYSELNKLADRVAARLRGLGVGRGALVGLCMERSPELIVAILAILKAGGAYVPLDPDYPHKRLSFMIRDTRTSIIVAHSLTASRLAPALRQAKVFWIESLDISSSNDENVIGRDIPADDQDAASREDLAYVMYTSGSTGSPKGVMIGHRAVVRLVRNTNYCRFGRDEVFLLHSPISFDASTFEIWGPLLNGGRLAIMAPRSIALDELGATIRRHGVTSLFLTSSLFNLMIEQRPTDLQSLRHLLSGGEAASPLHFQRAIDLLPGVAVVHVYGPTESTTFATFLRVTNDHSFEYGVPIGQPISNTTVHVLDEELRPVPVGTAGEVWIGGDGVAHGYLNQTKLTRQKFVPDPFSSKPDARLYRTGDVARRCPSGDIEFVGRLDNQVKISGHRIEPGEIEAALLCHPGVRQSAVMVNVGQRGEKQLVAYVVVSDSANLTAADLRDHLARHVPAYMIPAVFAKIASLPLSPSGKVDRSALPPLEQGVYCEITTDAPRASLSEAESSPSVAINQTSGRFSRARTVAGFWRNIRDGVECVSRSRVDERKVADRDATARLPARTATALERATKE